MPLDPGTAALVAGAAACIVLLFAWSLGNRHGTKVGHENGYNEGYHDRQHWETDELMKARIWAGERKA